jgi:superfamily II DNA/RNA helicase
MGFIPDVEKIAGFLPPLKQTLFFSATMPPEIRKLADRFLKNPKTVTVSPPASTAANVKQVFIVLNSGNDRLKREALRHMLKRENVQNAFIFCNRKRDVAMLHKSLLSHGFNAGALHGDMEQSERTATLDKFKRNEITLLVCSDVAARGLDVEAMSHVFNFDVPFHADDYVHRIGRTGRAGRSGTAYTFVTPEDAENVEAIEKLIKQKIEREPLTDLPEPRPDAKHHRKHGADRSDRSRRQAHGSHRRDGRHNGHASSHKALPHHRHQPAAPQQRPAIVETDGFTDNLPAFLRQPVAKGTA